LNFSQTGNSEVGAGWAEGEGISWPAIRGQLFWRPNKPPVVCSQCRWSW